MSLKPNYFVIPLITIAVINTGNFITAGGMNWYKTINLPAFTPPGGLIGLVWTVLFVLATISALLFWNKSEGRKKAVIATVFILNALLNVGWSVLFFGFHFVGLAVYEAGLLGASVLALVILIWPVSKLSSLLLLPYLAWVSFATFLTYNVWLLNK